MGKGDKKTRRGKINSGSYGKTRPKKSSKSVVISEKPEVAEKAPKAKKTKKAED
ncbi:30S ribosomal protein THX [Chryseobacterium defluvii]|uniref:SSU ribosomal protein S31P n=1 Tax=Chryseobacterium defluvii TaxID=160396 RepID=A0A495SKW0_9FLAO|nr:30S ribosomal protein THX [Chryseobacterium defluvii]RKT00911.1 SSU ribosomal protein S31P [Chryseobacterium defluvii]